MTEPDSPDDAPATVGAIVEATVGATVADPATPVDVPPPPVAGTRIRADPGPEDLLRPNPPREPTPLAARWLLAAAAAGVAADLALRRPPMTNVAGATLFAVLGIGLLASGFLMTWTSRLLAGGAMFFGLFLAIRTEPILLAFDLMAASLLLALAAVHGRDRSLWDLRPLRLLADGAVVLVESIEGLFTVAAEVAARARVIRERAADDTDNRTWAVLRGLAITAPIVLILGLLLASADAVFQSFFDGLGVLDIPSAIGHLTLMAFGAYALMVLLRLAHLQGSTSAGHSTRSLGAVETGLLLVSVNVLFAAFAVAQVLTVLGGADTALERAGLDPKQFARQGFFQLLWVAGLTLGLLMVLHVLTDEHVAARRLNRLLSPVTVALTVLIVGVAFTRIRFYIDEGGLTPLRLYSSVFALWVAVAFVITAVRIRGVRPTRAWLFPVLLVSGLMTLVGLNVVDIEGVIAADNLARTDDALYWHVEAGQFSGTGEAALVDRLDHLDPALAARIADRLCADHAARTPSSGWLSANLGQRQGQRALDRLCR